MEALASAIQALTAVVTGLTSFLTEKIKAVVEWLLGVVKSVVGWFSDLAVAIFKALWDMFTDLFCWCLDKLMTLVVSAANGLDLSGLTGFAPSSGLPEEIINVMQLCGVGTAVGIIISAIVLRLILQLIPFTRLGS
ncbi:DUF2523 family protein [Acidovorax sp. FJL06]|uniref:DUF2523 family protein n=1 Tax=Acidovorax sp. FJL06 TaxID=2153365 RepID=UPI000F5627F8|nr:DUF2523 family protein [Acidovorax sp. FJL06]RQO83722.1 hypothetical protein DBV10_02100 [Acidovorax sp. FJL06]